MLSITRSLARQLRAVFRRLAGRSPSVRPVVTLQANQDVLVARLHRVEIQAEFRFDASFEPGAIVLPLNALADFEGKESSAVNLEPGEGKTIARWTNRGLQQVKEYVLDDIELAGFPGRPRSMSASRVNVIAALADATRSTATQEIRYALAHVQLRGKTGQIVATDGRQLLLQGGFTFPWPGDVLIPGTPVFRCKEVTEATEVSMGTTNTHVVIHTSPWTFFLPIEKDARYPCVDNVVPSASKVASRCRIDPEDAQFLAQALPRLPGGTDDNSPITLDLDKHVIVRAKDSGTGPSTELVLAKSEHTGTPVPAAPKKARAKREKPATAKSLIEEAIALRTMLREACVRSNALIAALKKQKRQGRLLRETIASLRQLQQTGTD